MMNYRWLSALLMLALIGCDDGGDGGGDGADANAGGAGGEGGEGGGVVDSGTPPPVCSAATPVCEPGCAAGEACLFDGAACGCQTICNGTCDPGCDAATEICNAEMCECIERGCDADAPVCGPGGNNGCPPDQICNINCMCEAEPPPPPANLLRRPSRSSAIDITTDDSRVVMVNADEGSISIFTVGEAGAEARETRVRTNDDTPFPEPLAVVIHPNNNTVYVANRGAATIARIGGLGTASPTLMGEIGITGEPVGLALSPTGARLFATDWVAGHVVVINTETFAIERTIDVGGNPYAVAVTNDGDEDDGDEKVLVTQFFGRHSAEADDEGAQGIVQVFGVNEDRVAREISLAPLANCFANADTTTACFPNQLYAIAIHNGRAYVTSVAASPEGPVNFAFNMQALVSVIDLADLAEIPALARNLNSFVKDQQDADGDELQGRRFTNVINGIAFVNNEANIGYVTAGAGDIVVRLEYNADNTVDFGADQAFNIPVGQYPIGLVTKHGTPGIGDAFVANRVSRTLSVLSFRDQLETRTVESTAQPGMGTPEFNIWKGQRFFFTGTGIWSKEGWGSCAACHPHGLTDNVTWSFPAGPRQTVSLDGQYAPNDPTDMRALNWTAIFDETHDFELNTRTVSGGKGTLNGADGTPIASPMGSAGPFTNLMIGGRVENHQALNGSIKAVAADATICSNPSCIDFTQVDAWIQTMPRPNGLNGDSDALTRGRALFEEGGCTKCHAGPKWTVSRVFYDPASFTAAADGVRTFAVNAAFGTMMDVGVLVGLPMMVNTDATLVAGDDSNMGTPPFKRLACNIRNVGTFDAPGGAAEVRQNGQPAQGIKGFNPPSLLGLALGVPYFHDGGALTLEALIQDFPDHRRAGNPNFNPNPEQRSDLIAFLLSIDEGSEPFAIEEGTLLCPDSFP